MPSAVSQFTILSDFDDLSLKRMVIPNTEDGPAEFDSIILNLFYYNRPSTSHIILVAPLCANKDWMVPSSSLTWGNSYAKVNESSVEVFNGQSGFVIKDSLVDCESLLLLIALVCYAKK